MPIKAGDLMASAPGTSYTMVSDGKRLRVLWEPGHGDGDPSPHLAERCINTVKGHPTWKLFCGDIAEPIVRNENEPPRHVYLDDRACYAVLISEQYTKQEMRLFWPFDFDQIGKIRAGRLNRGRPAYVDDSCRGYATGPGRERKKAGVYIFSGAADTNDDVRPRSGKVKSEEGDIKVEYPSTLPAVPQTLAKATYIQEAPFPKATTLPKAPILPEAPRLGSARIPFEPSAPVLGRYIPGPTDGSLMPVGMAHKAIQGSPYFEEPTYLHRRKPRARGGDLAATLGALGVMGTKRKRVNVGQEQVKKPKVEEEDDTIKSAKVEECGLSA
jgi:hypothetical protein